MPSLSQTLQYFTVAQPIITPHCHCHSILGISIAFLSLHSSACLCSSPRRFALQSCSLPCRYMALLFNAFALSFDSMPMPNFAFLPLSLSIHLIAVAAQLLSVTLHFFAHPVIAIADHINSVQCLCFSWPFRCSALLRLCPASHRYSVAQRILALPSQCFTRPSRRKTERFNAFPQLRIA